VPLCYNLHCWTGNACLDFSLQHPKMHPTSFCTAKICYKFNLILPISKVEYNALRVKGRIPIGLFLPFFSLLRKFSKNLKICSTLTDPIEAKILENFLTARLQRRVNG
jgi:hypothetical protein